MSNTIAIVGIGCRFPGGVTDARSFWSMLRAGKSAIVEIPADRWSLDGFYDAAPDNPFRSYSKWGGFLDDIASFDPAFFGLSPREAEAMDPQQRILLQVAYEAAQDAGIALEQLRERRTGIFIGVSNTDYGLLQRFESGVADIQAGTGTALSIVANRISNLLDLKGPSMGVDTACSSSLVALDVACRSLREETADIALAGGVNILLDPRMFLTFCRAHMLSPTGRIAAFDARADGFVRGEGAGLVLLKRLADAERDGDRIYALVKATAVNQDGATDSITAPNPAAQKAMMRAAIEAAGVAAADVAYVEAHGTGTPLGDPIEASAIGEVFGQAQRDRAVLVGSVKCNLGHLEPAAGIAGLIKTALVLAHGEVPPTINFDTPNPRIPFDALNIEIASRGATLSRAASCALVNSFGFGGTNACAILARPAAAGVRGRSNAMRPSERRIPAQARRPVAIPLSAPTPDHLAAWARVLATAVSEGGLGGVTLEALGGALVTQRSHFDHRAVVFAFDTDDLVEKLVALAEGRDWPRRAKNDLTMIVKGRGSVKRDGKLVFTCTGQGGQYWNMGRDLLERQPIFRRFVEEFDALFAPAAGWSVLAALSAGERDSRLHDPAVTPAAMFALQAGLARMWHSAGIVPDIVIGHSFGEVTAAYLAGAIALADVAHLVNHRGLIRGHIHRVGAMAAIGLGADALAQFLPADGSIEIGAYNSPAMVTVSGEHAAVEDLIARLNNYDPNILAVQLELDFAWHSSWLEPGKEIFQRAVGDRPWRTPRIPVVSTVTGVPETRFDTDYWWRNLRHPVRFDRAVDCALDLGAEYFVELGPSRTLSSPTAACAAAKSREVVAVTTLHREQNNFDSFNQALAELYVAGRTVAWTASFGAEGERIALPPMPWLEQPLWKAPEEAKRAFFSNSPHPLLGHREAGPGHSWSSAISLAEFPVLGDHRIMGSCVLPGAAMIAIMHAAAADVFGAQAVELSDVWLPEALFLAVDDRVALRTEFDAERSRIRIWSRHKNGNEQWTLRAQARLFARGHDFKLSGAPHVAEASNAVDVADFYQMAAEKGYGFGPAFQGLRRITSGENALSAEVALPSESAIDDGPLGIRLLDSCLQAIIAMLKDDAGGPFLPERIDRILVAAPIGRSVHVGAASRLTAREGRAEFELSIADSGGRPCLQIAGLHATAIGMRRAETGRQTSAYIAEEFLELSPVPARTSTGWFVLALPGGERGDALFRVVAAGDHSSAVETEPDAIAQRVEIASAAGAQTANIVYARPLDLPETEDWPAAEAITREVTRLVTFGQILACLKGRAREHTTVWLLTRNARSAGSGNAIDSGGLAQSALIGAARTLAIECPGIAFRLVDFDRATLMQADWPRILSKAGDTRELIVRNGRIFASRLKALPTDETPHARKPPADGNFVLRQEGSRTLDALFWQEEKKIAPGPGEVRVRVDAAGLNFRDVMAAAGMLSKEAESGDAGGALGLEFCGIIDAAGEGVDARPSARVLGMTRGALCRYLTLPAQHVYPAPAGLSDIQAASVSSAYLTAHYALGHLGRVLPGEKVLVHSGAGGLGVAAVTLAKRLGAEVYATAGSREKREFLRSLGVQHVMDSHSLGFSDEVLRLTGGKGVDLVLNALHGPFIDKGLACLAPYGRFVELGKRDVYDDRAIGLRALRRNISLHVVDVAALTDERPALARTMMAELLDLFAAGEIPPPPVTVFPAGQVAEAFRYFSDAQHIGKIALDLRDPHLSLRQARNSDFPVDPQGTYLVTGGLSGFGFAIGQRLLEAGAGRVVLASRSGVARSDVHDTIEQLKERGADVATLALDVTEACRVEATIRALAAGPKPLKGVVHAAVTYADAALEQMNWDKIESVLATKVGGGLNLTQAVTATGAKLDFFISISSLAQVLGWRGQINYAAANAFLDGLANAQRSRGIPGFCVNLGMLGDAGHVARSPATKNYLQSAGWLPISNEGALRAIARALSSKAAVTTYAAADWKRLKASEAAIAASRRLDALVGEPAEQARTAANLAQIEASTRKVVAIDVVCEEVAAVLRLEPERIGIREPLGDLGLDSLSIFELRNRIETASGTAIPLARFMEAATVEALADLVCALVEGAARTDTGTPSAEPSAPRASGPESAATLLPRERRAIAMRAARMTSDHGRRALEVAFIVTLDRVIGDVMIERNWKLLRQQHAVLRALPGITQQPAQEDWSCRPASASDFAGATDCALADGESIRLVCAHSNAGTQIALRASRACLDQWAAALLMEDLLQRLGEVPIRRKPLAITWPTVRRDELARLNGPERVAHAAFWAEMLKSAPPAAYFPRRVRALAPAGFGLNRGPTARLHAEFRRTAASSESDMLANFARALGTLTGVGEFIIACDLHGREHGATGEAIGPVATTVPVVCRLPALRSSQILTERLARELQHIKTHAVFDLAVCEEIFAGDWRAENISPAQFGFCCFNETFWHPSLLTSSRRGRRFGTLIAYPGNEINAIENDVRLSIRLDNRAVRAELAYDCDAVEAEFAESLLEAFLTESSCQVARSKILNRSAN